MDKLATDMEAYGKGLLNEPVTSISIAERLEHDLQEQWSTPGAISDVALTPWKRSLLLQAKEVITICQSIPKWNIDS